MTYLLKFWTALKSFLQKAFAKENLTFTLIIIVTILIFLNLYNCNRKNASEEARKQEKFRSEQNLKAMTDTLKQGWNKQSKQWEAEKSFYITQNAEELAKYNQEFANKLSKIKGDIISAIDAKVKIDFGKSITPNKLTIVDESKGLYGLDWDQKYSDAGLSQILRGQSRFAVNYNEIDKKFDFTGENTEILENSLEVGLTFGHKKVEENGKIKYEVFAVSPSPKISLKNLEGAYFIENIDRNLNPDIPAVVKKPIGIGFYVGYGVNLDTKNKVARVGPSIGLSLQWSFLQFRAPNFKKK